MRRRSLTLLAGALVLAACGGADDGSAVQPAPDANAESTVEESTVEEGAVEDSATDDGTGSTTAPDTTPESTDTGSGSSDQTGSSGETSESTAPPAAESAPATTAPPADVRAPDGCSADNSPGETDVADGPLPDIEVRPASATNALPDLAVRRINCDGGWVNVKNELPGDEPLLVWFWAPH